MCSGSASRAAGEARGFGYLLKDRVLDTEVFLDQITTVGGGGTAIDVGVVESYLVNSRSRLEVLTDRELEVLGLVATGRSNVGIARQLVISPRTVEAHLRSILMKLGLCSDPNGNQRVLAALDWLTGSTAAT